MPVDDHLAAVVRMSCGIDISRFDEAFLASVVERRRTACGEPDDAAYDARLERDATECGELCRALVVTWSELFREPLAFALLEEAVLPDLARRAEAAGRHELRIWSAGCAGGEEACSVAILLDELAAARAGSFGFRVFATDVSPEALERARRSLFGPEAMRRVRLGHLRAYFAPCGDAWEVAPRIRDRLDVSRYDLLDARSSSPAASIFGGFDLVLCCNLLFYYNMAAREFIITKLREALVPGGCLVTGTAERAIVEGAGGLVAVGPPAPVYRRPGRVS